MKITGNIGFRKRALLAFITVFVVVLSAKASVSDDFTDRRITAGTKIFRAMLAADFGIVEKAAKDGNLRLCLLYVEDTSGAVKAAEVLIGRDVSKIRGTDIRIEMMPFSRFVKDSAEPLAGIFLAQPLDTEKLNSVIKYSVEHHIVVFSPFEGDVERGVQGGIAVEAQVRPYINIKGLQSAGVRLKSFFMRVAKQYEE